MQTKPAWSALALLLSVACGACGDSIAVVADATPADSDSDSGEIINYTTGCTTGPAPSATPYAKQEDFGPTVNGTLDGWIPNGRWFMTGITLGGRSSLFFAKNGGTLIVDRDAAAPGTIDANVAFQRTAFDGNGVNFSISIRVSNRHPDGTLRLDRAVCDNGSCRVCVARLVRAAWLPGETEGSKIVKLGEYRDPMWEEPAFTYNVRVLGNYAYVVRDDGMYIIDVSDPTNPVKVGHWVNGYTNDVKLVVAGAKTFALIADNPSKVVDVTNPAAPVTVAQINESAHTVFTENRDGKVYAYWGNYDATTPIYDVTNPAVPQLLGRFTTDGPFVHDMMVDNGIAYLNAWSAGMYRVDYTNPAAPVQVGRIIDTPTNTSHSSWTTVAGGRKIALHGGEAAGARLSIIDVDPASPQYMKEIGGYQTREVTSIHNVMAFGNRAYIAYYHDGVRVLDLSDPTNPVLIGYFNTWNADGPESSSGVFDSAVGIDVDLTKRLIYIADIPRGLIILQDQTPQ